MARRSRPGDPRTAVAYLRVSTDDQRLGLDAQRATIEGWAQREGVSVVAWHVDAGVSGGSELDERPGLVAALGGLRAARAGVLVIAKRDRIARDVAIALMVERAVVSSGAVLTSADGVGNGSEPADQFMRTILDAAAAYERSLIRARTKAALRAKRASGFRAGNVPFGFTADADGKLVPHEGEQAIVATVLELRAAGLSLRAIVAECARAGLVSRSGKPLGITQVGRITRAAS